MKHDALCPTQGKILKTNCQCTLIAKVRYEEDRKAVEITKDAIEVASQQYGEGFLIGYRTGRSDAADDFVKMLHELKLPRAVNVEYLIRNGLPKELKA